MQRSSFNFDAVIINNCPAFYKINLYNEIAKTKNIHVIFLGLSNQVVIDDDYKDKLNFSFEIINEFQVEERNKILTVIKLYLILNKLNFMFLIIGGYSYIEYIVQMFLNPKHKNILQTESASEAKLSGWQFFVKKMVLNRFSKAIVSGKMHKLMLEKTGFAGEIYISKGVGLIPENNVPARINSDFGTYRFLYVGRLIELKNLTFLINRFNENGLPLSIVGNGPLEEHLKKIANLNIAFLGYVANNQIKEIYLNHDIFVLPSLSEAWGLVVEEALQNKCVLMLSENVGSSEELLVEPNTGVTFDPQSKESFENALEDVVLNYQKYLINVINFDLKKKDERQVQIYTDLI